MDLENTNYSQYLDPLGSMEAALHGLNMRSKAIGSNIANVNTQGYIRREVNFEDSLQQKLAENKEEFPTQKFNESIQTQLDLASPSTGASNVNIEREMLDLTQTGLRFKAVSNMAKKYFENMRGIIRG